MSLFKQAEKCSKDSQFKAGEKTKELLHEIMGVWYQNTKVSTDDYS